MALAMAGFTLGIRPISSLLPHEETIPLHARRLAEDMRREGIQRDPMIIDRESAAVLDGMHRLAAFAELQIENAVCCSIDYGSSAVSLGRWARVYTVVEGSSVRSRIEELDGAKRTTLAEAFSSLESRESAAGLLTADAAYLFGGKGNEEVVDFVTSFDKTAAERGWERTFVPEDEIDVPLQETRRLVLLPRRITKEDVLWAARRGKLFPCKTSMHSIDPRPVAVNFPIRELDSANASTLKERLHGKNPTVKPRGTVYEGRRYKERLLFLDQE